MPVLDTTLLVQAERHTAARDFVAQLVEEGEPLLVPVQVAIEFAAGREDPGEAIRRLREAFVVVPMGPELALEAARLANAALRAGRFPAWAGIHIAATAHHEGMAIVSNNARDFEGLGIRRRPHP